MAVEITDSTTYFGKQESLALTAPPPQPEDNLRIKEMSAPSTNDQSMLRPMELTSEDPKQVMDNLRSLYDRAIADPQRRAIFQRRMENIQKFDPELLREMGDIGKDIANNASPESIGKKLALALQHTVERHAKNGKPVDLTSNEFLAVMGGLSGLMLAARTSGEDTVRMVKAAEQQLGLDNRRNGIAAANGARMEVHPVIWDDNKEPAICAYTPGQGIDPLRFKAEYLSLGAAVKTSPKKPK